MNEIKFTYNNGKLELLTTSNTPHVDLIGEYYYIKTLDEIMEFIVNDKDKTLIIRPIQDKPQKNIPKTIHFKLWEESYTDIIFPGKIEKIHRSTLVRSIEYTIHDEIIYMNDFNDLKEALSKTYDYKKHYTCLYENNPKVLSILPYFAYMMKQSNINFTYKPNDTFKIEKLQCLKINRKIKDHLNLNNYEWLVFSKTDKNFLYLAPNYNQACMMLAKLKFDNVIPHFICGVALFEDYYFMPLMYNIMSITNSDDISMNMRKFKLTDI